MKRFVIDTSLFVNPHVRIFFGKTSDAAVKGFLKKTGKKKSEFYMPPSVFKELSHFLSEKVADELELHIKKRAPNTYAIYLPAAVLYDFIEDVRRRLNKGLRLAEQFAQDNQPDNQPKLRKLRDKYRDAMRAGLVDSKEDFELILLSKELEGILVSSDEGVLEFATKIGCETLHAKKLSAMLKKLK